jgi:predicted phosphodiesterase
MASASRFPTRTTSATARCAGSVPLVRVAALYDVHGNLPALEAVLEDVDRAGANVMVSGGDLVWGPYPSECLELLRERGALFIAGNTERLVLERASELHAWAHDRLTADQRAAAASWPATLELDVDRLGRALFCHASPQSDREPLTAETPDAALAEAVAGTSADIVVCGHTHHQFDRRVGSTRIVNAGSVGMPWEGRPGAFWALIGPEVELRRTDYDVDAATERLRTTGLASIDEYVRISLDPVSRERAIDRFEREARRRP